MYGKAMPKAAKTPANKPSQINVFTFSGILNLIKYGLKESKKLLIYSEAKLPNLNTTKNRNRRMIARATKPKTG